MLDRKNLKQFIIFCLVGTTNAIIDFAVYLFLTRVLNVWSEQLTYATMVSFLVANFNSYFMNKYWTFKNKEKLHHVQLPKFFVVTVLGLGLNALCFYILTYYFGLFDVLSKVIVAGIVLFWNFTLNKFWTFKVKKDEI